MMNKELINKLRQEAWQYANNYAGDDVMPQLQRFEQKFAELIVKECMNLCSEVKEDLELVPDKLTRDAAEMGVTFCYEAIKGEFGVEE